MILVISLIIILIIIIILSILFLTSNKRFKELLNEIIYELIYNVVGFQGIIDDVLCKSINKAVITDHNSKVALITGGCRGIGVEVIKMFLKCDMNIIVGCRNTNAAMDLLKDARKEGITTGDLKAFTLDVSSLESVRSFAEQIKQNYSKINILLNNAGIMYVPFAETVDGFESQLATNYLGHFLLTHHLLPLLKAAGENGANARIVNVSSIAHEQGQIYFKDIHFKKMQYIPLKAYAQSKLAQVLFTIHLNKVLQEEGSAVQVNAVHPGIVNTNLFDDTYIKILLPWAVKLMFKAPIEGAQPIVYTCIAPHLEGKGGTYVSNCRLYPVANIAKSVKLQAKLFQFTNKLLNIENYGSP